MATTATKILIRPSLAEIGELREAALRFSTITSRLLTGEGDLVIARYSALPFYKELEDDLRMRGAELINSFEEHRYIADLRNWYRDLKEWTPPTWKSLADIPPEEKGPFVLKGETNSRKHLWRTHMYAENRDAVPRVLDRLLDDSLISQQDIYVRKFIPMVSYGEGINGLPITKEFRIFICDNKVVSKGFYWSNHAEDITVPDVAEIPKDFIETIIERVGMAARFWVMDVGQLTDGRWMVVELNDGQMSGLSCIPPAVLYTNLAQILEVSEPEGPAEDLTI